MSKNLFLTLLHLLPLLVEAQIDSLHGNVKSIRERLVFLDSTIQNMKLFSNEGEYGHNGFTSPEFTFGRFNSWWFHTPWVHYLNYLRQFDSNKNLKEETWYYKSDRILEKITYEYDEKNNIIQAKEVYKDSSFTVTQKNYNYLGLLKTSISYSSFMLNRFEYDNYL